MMFSEVLGLRHIKKHLTISADAGRIPHAQLFVGPEGSGTLAAALAYARYLLCGNTGGENAQGDPCNSKCASFTHPDLHFAYPVAARDKGQKHPVSDHFITEWRNFVKEQPYGTLSAWYRHIGIEKKQGLISVHEAQDIVRKLSLKSYEGGFKVMILWRAEKLNTEAANKLLKLIEEPPSKTVFLFIAEDESQLLQTIRSRCQVVHFPPLGEDAISSGLKRRGVTPSEASRVAQQAEGNFSKALDLLNRNSEELEYEAWFTRWVRTAFRARGNKSAIHELIKWSEDLAGKGREVQKDFLHYCLAVFRQAMLINYGAEPLAYLRFRNSDLDLHKFAPFVHENNIEALVTEVESAIYHIERNGNARLILTDLSIKLTRLLHKKAA